MFGITVDSVLESFSEWFVGIGRFAWDVFLKPNPWLLLPAGAALTLVLIGVLRRKH